MMTSCPTLRIATADDASTLDSLNAVFNGSSDGPEAIMKRIADPRRVDIPLLAEVDGQVAGFACLRIVPNLFYPEPYAELTELYVEPDHRRRGVGRALVAFAEELAKEKGAKSMKILTGDDNEAALGLYRGMVYENDDISLWKRL